MAFSELHRRHYPSLRAFVFHLLGSHHRHEDAEDVVQDAFARAFDALSERTFSGDFRRWIFTIARNRSIDLLRGERVRLVSLDAEGIDAPVQEAAEATTPVAVAESREEVAWLVTAIEKLPERQRSALLLRELAGLSHTEIAGSLGTTTGSARQLITRARDGIRVAAERDGREHDTGGRRSLQRDLLNAAPVLPVAAASIVTTAGTTAVGGFALGKIAATVIAAIVLAGTAGIVEREVAEANGSKSSPEVPLAVEVAGSSSAERVSSRADRASSNSRADSKFSNAETAHKQEANQSPAGSSPGADQPKSEANESSTHEPASEPVPDEVAEPVEKVVELPAKVVEHVVGGLDGSTPLDQTVGNAVGEVTGTLGEVTSDLLGGPTAR